MAAAGLVAVAKEEAGEVAVAMAAAGLVAAAMAAAARAAAATVVEAWAAGARAVAEWGMGGRVAAAMVAMAMVAVRVAAMVAEMAAEAATAVGAAEAVVMMAADMEARREAQRGAAVVVVWAMVEVVRVVDLMEVVARALGGLAMAVAVGREKAVEGATALGKEVGTTVAGQLVAEVRGLVMVVAADVGSVVRLAWVTKVQGSVEVEAAA